MNVPTLYAPNAFEQALTILPNYFEEQIRNGVKFHSEETVQCGWMWFKLFQKDGGLSVLAPEFGKMPINFIEDCSDALNLILTQKYLIESFNADFGWCDLRHSAIVLRDFDKSTEKFMSRLDDVEGASSGWYFGSNDGGIDPNDPENLELLSLWEVLCKYPFIGDFMLLPLGWQVFFEDKPVVLYDYEKAEFKSDSYYEQKYLTQT